MLIMFTKNVGTVKVSIMPPVGSLAAYLGLGTIDPSGWVIADGAGRANTSGLYNRLLTIGVGSQSNNVYYPPNYKGAFLRGTGTSGVYTGPSINQSQFHATQTHNHSINDPTHSHGIYNSVNGGGVDANSTNDWIPANFNSYFNKTSNLLIVGSSATGITVNDSYTSVDTNETRPYNYGVNWIIKL